MCANKTCSSVITTPVLTFSWGDRSTIVNAMIVLVEAFREALAMRRAAQKSYRYLLNDE